MCDARLEWRALDSVSNSGGTPPPIDSTACSGHVARTARLTRSERLHEHRCRAERYDRLWSSRRSTRRAGARTTRGIFGIPEMLLRSVGTIFRLVEAEQVHSSETANSLLL